MDNNKPIKKQGNVNTSRQAEMLSSPMRIGNIKQNGATSSIVKQQWHHILLLPDAMLPTSKNYLQKYLDILQIEKM